MIRIIAIGKKHEAWIAHGLERYQTRLKRPFDVEWVLLPHSSLQGREARQEESERILSRLDRDDLVILLDETGKNVSSPEVAGWLEDAFVHSRPVTLVIGGAYGVTDEFATRADIVWSLSKLVFPHQLVRLILLEQLYRAQEIARGSGYHHE